MIIFREKMSILCHIVSFCSLLLFQIFVGVWCAAEPGLLYSVRPEKRRKRKGDRRDRERGRQLYFNSSFVFLLFLTVYVLFTHVAIFFSPHMFTYTQVSVIVSDNIDVTPGDSFCVIKLILIS